MWIFGYGSLIWKIDFPYVQKQVGYIKGYKRRFWQASTDHRGIPGKPGRVVTLVKSQDLEARVWGMSYLIPQDKLGSVLEHLDYREIGGYQRTMLEFYPKDGKAMQVLMYWGTEENEFYIGPENIEDTAVILHKSVGPSGKNTEYLYNLCEKLRDILPVDDDSDAYIFQLEHAVRSLDSKLEK